MECIYTSDLSGVTKKCKMFWILDLVDISTYIVKKRNNVCNRPEFVVVVINFLVGMPQNQLSSTYQTFCL